MAFLYDALRLWLDKKSKDKQARSAYDARYTNNPMWTLRNQLLTSLWRDNNLQERFAGAFPRQEDYQPGTSYKTPENVLINLTTPPRYTGRPGTGFDFAGALTGALGQAAQQAAMAAASGGTSLAVPGGGVVPAPGGSASSLTGVDSPVVPFDQAWDPFRYRT